MEGESLALEYGITSNRMYLVGMTFTAVTDHKPLVPLYNNPKKPGPMRVDRHRLRLQPYDFTVIHEPGNLNPCDYGSRHPISLDRYTPRAQQELAVCDDVEIHVNHIIADCLPEAITWEIMAKATNRDRALCKLKTAIWNGQLPASPEMRPYEKVFEELSVARQLVMRGERIVAPESLRADLIQLAHAGHMGETKTKNYLRTKVWYPGMDSDVDTFIKTCLACTAARPGRQYEPVKSTPLPEGPWKLLATDFKGPIEKNYYVMVVVDAYTRYVETAIVGSTAAEEVIPAFDEILCRHGIPEEVVSDNGPPFNSEDWDRYSKSRGFYAHQVTAETPWANGLAEKHMSMIGKVIHTAVAERKDPRIELQSYLLSTRATPHPATGKAPAELLFNRQFRTTLPSIIPRPCDSNIRERDAKFKREGADRSDKAHKAHERQINTGDKVLMQNRKTRPKHEPFYDLSLIHI